MRNPTKVVLRHLPPCLTEEEFMEIVSPLPAYNYLRFFKADKTIGSSATTRAYINFQSIESLFNFKERFDNYVFVDSKVGNFDIFSIMIKVCVVIMILNY